MLSVRKKYLIFLKTLALVAFLLLFSGYRSSRELTSSEKEKASEIVLEYIDTFQSFSNAGDMNDAGRQMIKLIELYERRTHRHYNDLFEGNALPVAPEIMHYLNYISVEYKYQLDTEFKVISEIKSYTKEGICYASCDLEKTIKYNGKQKNVYNSIVINMDYETGPKINLIRVPKSLDEPIGIILPPDTINIPPTDSVIVDIKKDEIAELTEEAKGFMKKNEFEKSLQILKKIENLSPNDADIKKYILICENQISYNYYKNQADNYYTNQKYYARAIELYERALTYIPGDGYALNQIKKCKAAAIKAENSPEAISKQLEVAVKLWNNGKYYKAFEILYKYEDSNMLQPGHYFMLGEALITNWDRTRGKMGWNASQCISKGANYMRKAALSDWKYNNIALKRYCDLRSSTIEKLKLNKLNCALLDEE